MTTGNETLPAINPDLLDAAVIAHLASQRPDGSLQSNPVSADERIVVSIRPTAGSAMGA